MMCICSAVQVCPHVLLQVQSGLAGSNTIHCVAGQVTLFLHVADVN
jgi:hypothetical protein